MLCIYCLVSVLIFKFMCYIWRKWHLSEFIKNLFKYSIICELDKSVSFFNYINNLSYKLAFAKTYLSTNLSLLSRLNKNFPCILSVFKSFKEKHFNSRSCINFSTYKSCWYYLSVINNKTVTRLKIIYDISEYLMFNFSCFFIKHHKS